MVTLGSYGGEVRLVGGGDDDDEVAAAEEVMLLWGMQQPTSSKPNSFVAQSSLLLPRGSLRSLPIYPAVAFFLVAVGYPWCHWSGRVG
ncbi:hypothetical protein MLD38_032886 [Melastoma candidum]|uniref:Uncharacterized protein n=1 Tax=Melastoma candidum TaxID=119954 RepID=A0ACB9M5K3_9MYRT|nr:hypothetical protein MLD38_032886 [Melastoma candidum]